ncbi:hypothetical protein L208DRAFT_1405291 [Tricholoma matsutake]|nr:hypothetical protein L208DRAFT_1405291 [Tricholoma matsutake 945]
MTTDMTLFCASLLTWLLSKMQNPRTRQKESHLGALSIKYPTFFSISKDGTCDLLISSGTSGHVSHTMGNGKFIGP